MALRFDGTTVIPIFLDAPHYREWECTLDGEDYSIVNENGADGDWLLLHWAEHDRAWQAIRSGPDVDAFLRQHALILGN